MITLFQEIRSLSTQLLLLALCLLFTSSARAQTTPRYAVKPAASDAYFIVSGNGSDTTGDGLSGGSAYATWAKAKASCGSTPCVVTILETAASAGCPDGTATIVTFDYRSLATPCGNNDISLNSGPSASAAHSLLRVSLTSINPGSNSQVASIDFGSFTGSFSTGTSVEGHTAEGTTTGAISTTGTVNLLGEEGFASPNSTGGTLAAVYGVLGHADIATGNTTAVTETAGVRGYAPTNAGTGTVTNAYGGHFSQPTIGATDNYAVYVDGSLLVDNDSVASGINFVGSSGARFPIITETHANDAILFRPIVASIGFSFQDSSFDHWLDLNNTGAKLGSGIPLLLVSSGGGTIVHQAPNTASSVTVTDPVATTLTPVVGTCTMSAGTTCTITVVSGATSCVATDNGGTVAGECSISGTTLTVTAASSNSSKWAVLWW